MIRGHKLAAFEYGPYLLRQVIFENIVLVGKINILQEFSLTSVFNIKLNLQSKCTLPKF